MLFQSLGSLRTGLSHGRRSNGFGVDRLSSGGSEFTRLSTDEPASTLEVVTCMHSDEESATTDIHPSAQLLSPSVRKEAGGECAPCFDRRASSRKKSELRSRQFLTKNKTLLRAAPPSAVLMWFAQVFSPPQEVGKPLPKPSLSDDSGEETMEEEHTVADKCFYSIPEVQEVNVFVSHSWSAPRWQKALAMFCYVNLQLAVSCAIATWLLVMVVMVAMYGPTGMGGNPHLLFLFVVLPMAVFYLTLFFGHYLWTPVKNLWLDRLCIHQSRGRLKRQGIQALPEIVAGSGRMLILWSDDYFDRIWCNAEIAAFSAVQEGAENIDFMPLWLAPWVLSVMTLNILSVFISNKLFVLIPTIGSALAKSLHSYWAVSFFAQFLGVGIAFSLGYLCAVLPTWHSFRSKLNTHDGMLRQCESYSLTRAKCSVESDRPVVRELICGLFVEARDPLLAFDRFMNRGLSEHITARIGHPGHIPYRVCLLVFLPLTFSAAANVWGCDDMPCEIAATAELGEGVSVAQQMLTNFFAWSVGVFGVYPTVYPVILLALSTCRSWCGGRRCLERLLSFLVIILGYAYMGFHEGFAAGIINGASAQSRVSMGRAIAWSSAVVVYLVLLTWCHVRLFWGKGPRKVDSL